MGTHPIFESDFDCLTDFKKCMLKEIAFNRLCVAAYSKQLPMKRWAIPNNRRSGSQRVSVWMDHDKATYHGDWYTGRYKQTRHRQNIEMRHRQMNSPSVNRGRGAPICPTEF